MYTDKSILSFWTDVNFAATSFSQKQAIKKTNEKKSYTHFEITDGPCNLISSKSHHIFCFKSHLFPSQWGGYTENKTTNKISRLERQRVLFLKLSFFPLKKWMNLISNRLSPVLERFQNGCNKVVIEPRVEQFWSEIILMISNRTHAARLFDFEITRMISAQIALHSVQLPLFITH